MIKEGVLVASHGTFFFKESAHEALGRKFFSIQKSLKNFARANGFGFITINLAEERILPQVMNGGCPVSRIYSSQRMGTYEFWNTPRIKAQSLCHNCDGSCHVCCRAVALGSRKLASWIDESFESEVGDLDWRDNQDTGEQEQDYRTQIGDYCHICSESDELSEPSITDILVLDERLDFFELERRMLQQEAILQEAARRREEHIRASHIPLAVLISRKEMGESLSPEEEKVLAEGLNQVQNEANRATVFHQCGWFTSLRYPELNGKKHRCNLCAKWRQAGDKIWHSRRTQDISVMNANILIRNPEKIVSDAKMLLQGCRNIYRSHFLDHLVCEFKYQISTGIMPWDIVPSPFMWENHMDRIRYMLVDLDSIGWFGTVKDIEELVISIFNSVSKTEKKDAVIQLISFLQGFRAAKGLKNPPIRSDSKMISEWLDSLLSSYGLPYSDNFWCPPNYKTPAICMNCWLQRKGVC